jgi:hypothetical protein
VGITLVKTNVKGEGLILVIELVIGMMMYAMIMQKSVVLSRPWIVAPTPLMFLNAIGYILERLRVIVRWEHQTHALYS